MSDALDHGAARRCVPTPFDARTAALQPVSAPGSPGPATPRADALRVGRGRSISRSATRRRCLRRLGPMRKYRDRAAPTPAAVIEPAGHPRPAQAASPAASPTPLWCDDDGHGARRRHRVPAGRRRFPALLPGAAICPGCSTRPGASTSRSRKRARPSPALSLQGPTCFAVLEARRARREAGSPEALRSAPSIDGILDLAHRLHRRSRLRAVGPDPSARWPCGTGSWRPAGSTACGPSATPALDSPGIEAGFIMAGRDFVLADHAVAPTRGRSPFELGLRLAGRPGKGPFQRPPRAPAPSRRRAQRYGPWSASTSTATSPRTTRCVYHRRKDRGRPCDLGRLVADLQAQPRPGHAQGPLTA